ncbi:MAG: hypothetical protein F6K42_13980 [Leptolyngbya sp. SIO1D8]|nr:hypothetical protein [Leptolyngbya sp. SIO1D8]
MSETTLDFVTLRQPERIKQKVKRLRYIRDLRKEPLAPLRKQLIDADAYSQKVILAQQLVSSKFFFTVELFYKLRYEVIVDILRADLRGPVTFRDGSKKDGTTIVDLITALEEGVLVLGQSQFFHTPKPPKVAVASIFLQYGLIWDSLYATTILAGIRQVETNYLIDAIRTLHLLTVLRLENLKQPAPINWPYYDFDAYEAALDENIVRYKQLI